MIFHRGKNQFTAVLKINFQSCKKINFQGDKNQFPQ